MKESYVSYECAKRLKECGFDWECDHYYELQKEFREARVFPATFRMSDFWHNFNEDDQPNQHNQPFYPMYSAPSLSLAQKWLREVKGLSIRVSYIQYHKTWFADWLNLETGEYDDTDASFDTYELALSAGIDASLKLLTDKQ